MIKHIVALGLLSTSILLYVMNFEAGIWGYTPSYAALFVLIVFIAECVVGVMYAFRRKSSNLWFKIMLAALICTGGYLLVCLSFCLNWTGAGLLPALLFIMPVYALNLFAAVQTIAASLFVLSAVLAVFSLVQYLRCRVY